MNNFLPISTNHIQLLIDKNQLAMGGKSFILGLVGVPFMTLIHEAGHYTAMKVLFEDVNPEISLENFGFSGETKWGGNARILTSVGKLIGHKASYTLVVAAGPLAETITGIGLVALTGDYDLIVPAAVINAMYCINNDPGWDFQIIRNQFPNAGKIFSSATLAASAFVAFKSRLMPQILYNYANCISNLICTKP